MNEPSEIDKLQLENESLRQQLADCRSRNWSLDTQLKVLRGQTRTYTVQEAELGYWISKCHRQRLAINQIQRKGWYPPEYVIHEEDPFGPLREVA